MNEADRPTNEGLILRIVQRLAVAVATIEALDSTQPELSADSSALRRALQIARSINNGIRSGATPAQLSGLFGDLTSATSEAVIAWERDGDLLLHDPDEWRVEEDRRQRLRIDFHTLRARLYPEGRFGSE